jgi:superfamily I DNA/RNA helicase
MLAVILPPVTEALALAVTPLDQAAAASGSIYAGPLPLAKGLEFRAVALVGVDDDCIPLASALAAEESEEGRTLALDRERHLLYVGCTRARESLLITHGPKPSRFIGEARTRGLPDE